MDQKVKAGLLRQIFLMSCILEGKIVELTCLYRLPCFKHSKLMFIAFHYTKIRYFVSHCINTGLHLCSKYVSSGAAFCLCAEFFEREIT